VVQRARLSSMRKLDWCSRDASSLRADQKQKRPWETAFMVPNQRAIKHLQLGSCHRQRGLDHDHKLLRRDLRSRGVTSTVGGHSARHHTVGACLRARESLLHSRDTQAGYREVSVPLKLELLAPHQLAGQGLHRAGSRVATMAAYEPVALWLQAAERAVV
jgi:hypothetical protein